ncbi:efflux RND transporter permease subunit [Methylotenera versatilis]|uniref:Heavy metal efflux pump, CzcA family n=1 Tax=Methylotenera versatilis (strain 301) TaxID=666681 RepID=D7DIF7_METV0|nr:CusA/CzcA family heavy metal efflux RND transporter [Methylotenera versatilis]ADI29842.1 heavy metal efflux pump, CzcA family [Methylotenera versatilis 301]
MNKLIEISLKNPLLIFIFTACILFGGLYAAKELPIDAFPDVSSTQVKIIMKSPGLTPEEVEARITAPLEIEMLGLPNQTMLRSVAKYGLTDITIDFADGTDIYWARNQVAERINAVRGDLPSDATGGIAPMTTPLGEMLMFTVEGGGLSLTENRSLLDWVIRPQLRSLEGVADVNSLGGKVKTFEIVPDLNAMQARGITLDSLQIALERNNRNDGAGRLSQGEEAIIVRSEGRINALNDILNTVVKADTNVVVRVKDIASVNISNLTRNGAVSHNGQGEVVEGLVLGLRGANAQKLVEGVKAKLAEIEPTLPKGVKLNIFYNRGNLVDKAIHGVSKAMLEAIVLVLILLMLFLGNIRAAVTVALVLPLSALVTFMLMRYFGVSANLMSLGGLTIAIGMLVDAAVVVVENIESKLAHYDGKSNKIALILQAVKEVSTPVISGIVIIIVVFLPLLTLQGLEGKLFAPVALTIVFALAASLLLSLTVIPVFAAMLITKKHHAEPWLVRQALRVYTPILKMALNKSKLVMLIAITFLVLTMVVYTQIGKTFMPTMDEGDIIMGSEKLPSITLNQSVAMDNAIQKAILKDVPEVAQVVSRVGSDELGLDPMGLNQTDNFVILKPRDQWRTQNKDDIIDSLRQVMTNFAGIDYSFTQPIDMRVNEMILGVRGDLAIKLYGTDLKVLGEKAEKIKSILEGIQGAQDVYTPQNSGVQYLSVNIDREKAGRLGFDVTRIQDALRVQVEGLQLGIVQEAERRIPLVIKGAESLRLSPADFANIRITSSEGVSVPLATLATLDRIEGPVKIDRERASRMVVVTSNVKGRDLVSFVEEAKQKITNQVKLDSGYRIQFGGQFENQQRAAQRLSIVIPIAILMIFILLFSTFHSIRQTVLILANIPFAMIGGVFALWVSGEYLSVPASVGFIALLGIAVLNGVVMMTYFNQLEDEGLQLIDVVMEGAKRRLRPVLMTASIAAFGLVPLLFATGPGSEIQKPLAIVVIGGLITSTILTLILLPMLYQRFGGRR